MKRMLRVLCLLLVCVLTFSLIGCQRAKTTSMYYAGEEEEENESGAEEGNETAISSEQGGTASRTQSQSGGNTSSGSKTTKRGNDLWKIARDVKTGGSGKILNGLNFGGKTFRMLVHQSNFTDLMEKQVQEFAKKYNCTIKIDSLNFEDNLSAMATSLSAGKPYDIVLCHSAFFPQIAVANLCQPLESVISKDDLATQYGKQGLNWNFMMQSATWANHVYFTIDNKPCYLPIVYYNKLLIDDFGLEDPMELYKKGQWTYDKIFEYAKIVKNANQGIYFLDSSLYPGLESDFYDISADGTVNWYGANTKMVNGYETKRKFEKVGTSGDKSLVDNFVAGKTICALMEAEKLVSYTKVLKDSAAIGKNLKNIGIVPVPLNARGTYATHSPVGYAACRGTDPKAAVALAVYLSNMQPSWVENEIPELKTNTSLLTGLYNKMSYANSTYYFLTSSGKRIEQEIYDMKVAIDKGGDIMKLLQSYAPTVKSIIEYNLEKQ